MDQHRYHNLVTSLEVDSKVHPELFRAKVLLVSSAAYVVLFGALVGLLLLIYFGIETAYHHGRASSLIRLILFSLVMLPVFYVVLKTFLTPLPPPDGRPITREEAPKLFGVIDKMQAKLNGPVIDHVLINEEYNAAIMQRPRWGLFGKHTNYLILGLPYMLGVPPKEMLATIAHEYGHLCENHGKLGVWVYRQRRTFFELYDLLEQSAEDNWVQAYMFRALQKFMPHYNAYTFVLSRQNEYQADQTATELVGASVNASSLIRDELLGRWIQTEFWPGVFRRADISAEPVFLPYASMRIAFIAAYPQWATQENLDAAWNESSGLHDTHPALRDRVEATGEEPTLPACVEITAADALLGGYAKTLIAEFDQEWWSREKDDWTARHHHVMRSKTRLKQLVARPMSDLELGELQELATLSAEFAPRRTAMSVLEHLMAQRGGPFPKAEYHYGCLLLADRNDRGLAHLATAARTEAQLTESAINAGYAYLCKERNEEAAEKWVDKLWANEAVT